MSKKAKVLCLAIFLVWTAKITLAEDKPTKRIVSEKLIGHIDRGILPGTLIVSPNSKRFAYVTIAKTKAGTKYYVVVDGNEGKQYSGIMGTPIFSPDSKRIAYVARLRFADKAYKYVVVVNREEGKRYDTIMEASPITFSPDSKRLTYMVVHNGEFIVVVDGKEKEHDALVHTIFSPDSKRLAYVAKVGNKYFVVVDGKEQKKYDSIFFRPAFSPDSKRLLYSAKEGDELFMVVDGEEQKKPDGPGYQRHESGVSVHLQP